MVSSLSKLLNLEIVGDEILEISVESIAFTIRFNTSQTSDFLYVENKNINKDINKKIKKNYLKYPIYGITFYYLNHLCSKILI